MTYQRKQIIRYLLNTGIELLLSICVAVFIWLMTKIMDYLSVHIPQSSYWAGPIVVYAIITAIGILYWIIFLYPVTLLKRGLKREALFSLIAIIAFLVLETALFRKVLYSLPENQF